MLERPVLASYVTHGYLHVRTTVDKAICATIVATVHLAASRHDHPGMTHASTASHHYACRCVSLLFSIRILPHVS